MRTKKYINILLFVVAIFSISSCAVTKNIPKDEVLYTGSKIKFVETNSISDTELVDELEASLSKAPSTSMFGGFVPIPFKMWAYNAFVKYEKGIGKWLFNKLAANPPIYISTLNPDVRTKIAHNLLKDYGYFSGDVKYDVVYDKKDSLKASVVYTIHKRTPYIVDDLRYQGFDSKVQDIMNQYYKKKNLYVGDKFNVIKLNLERERISSILRNQGYYYFRPEYIKFEADTTIIKGGYVFLRGVPSGELPVEAQLPYNLDKSSVYIVGGNGESPTDSIRYRNMTIHYHKKLKIRPKMLYRWTNYKQFLYGKAKNVDVYPLYNQSEKEKVQEKLSKLNIFNYVDYTYDIDSLSARKFVFNFKDSQGVDKEDSIKAKDTYSINLNSLDFEKPNNYYLNEYLTLSLSKPLDAELEFNVVTKSNNQTGPGMSFGINRHNIFGGGERLGVRLKGSYEWQTGAVHKSSVLNSWEIGATTSLLFPRVILPYFSKKEFEYPASTTFKLYANQLNRAKYYKMLSFGGEVTYDFKPTNISHHSVTPFKLTFNLLQNYYDKFAELLRNNPILMLSFQDQFIPSIEYTYTYDNANIKTVRNPIWWQTTIKSAGNLTSIFYKLGGEDFSKRDKNLFGAPFAQFVKLNTEFRYQWNIDRNNKLATRVALGGIYAYGNSTVAPYVEHFYVGGANSIRAFTVRSIGPGGYHPESGRYSYLDQVGSLRYESNLEFRFRIFQKLWGTTFVDAGNVWMIDKDEDLPNSNIKFDTFFNQIALGTGFGLRYDFDILVFRFDVGIPLHYPYYNGTSDYFNVKGSFFKNMGLHFAIGYPF